MLVVDVSPFVLIVLAVVGYVAYRAALARRRGGHVGAAAGRALAEAAPPAIAVGVGVVLLYLALGILMAAFVFGLMAFVITVPFDLMGAMFTGHAVRHSFGPLHGMAIEAYALVFFAMLAFLGACCWIAVVAVRRARRPAAVVPVAAPMPSRQRPLRAERRPRAEGP